MKRPMGDVVKRAIDLTAAVIGLLVCSPLIAVTALLVRVAMGRPVLFRQLRPGRHGEPFQLIKFRTMRMASGSDSERLTRFGRWLRSTSLDELPELWNVLRGDMSLVGPRPLLVDYLPLYDQHQARRHEVRPGLTGLAQVSGRNLTTWEERLKLDVQYVDERTLRLDLEIIVRTARAVLRREGISAAGEDTMARFTGSGTGRNGHPCRPSSLGRAAEAG